MVIEMMFRVAVIMGALWTGRRNAVKAAIVDNCRNRRRDVCASHDFDYSLPIGNQRGLFP
ncbi:hypothetical protein DCO57_00605 [Labrenzia sp. 011]|nr:hypothetical protein DCO57_00605 [Labrenzia sp. 011]